MKTEKLIGVIVGITVFMLSLWVGCYFMWSGINRATFVEWWAFPSMVTSISGMIAGVIIFLKSFGVFD